MRALQPAALAWDDIPRPAQLDVLVYDMIEGGHWDTVGSWARTHDREGLQHALALRKQIWDKNRLLRAAQDAYIETSTYYVSYDHRVRGVRNCLLELLGMEHTHTAHTHSAHTHSPDARSSASPGKVGGG
jgi:hypothetical protein